MRVIPAVDILNGKCVQLIGGDPNKKRIELEKPIEVARKWCRMGANLLHVIDLNAALNRSNNMNLIARMAADLEVPIQVGGGLRDNISVMTVMAVGCKRAILGTMAIQDRAWLKRVTLAYPSKIVVAVDARGRNIVIKGWKEEAGLDLIEFAQEMDELNLAGLLYTNVDVEGQLSGTDLAPVRELVESCRTPIIASGGITSMDDLRALADIGVESVVVGTAIYTGDIDLAEALEEFD
jgi:phosphoribosylformimino-5-aminoimidazole carboxamide ribotide isomerase